MNSLTWLMQWFKEHCDGEWEHDVGVRICTLDNPGWSVTVGVEGTELEEKTLTDEFVQDGDVWHRIARDASTWQGDGSPDTLPMLLERFRTWAEEDAGEASS